MNLNTEHLPYVMETELPEDTKQKLKLLDRIFKINALCIWIERTSSELTDLPLAQRFSKTQRAGGEVGLSSNVNPLLCNTTEVEYKKRQLSLDLQRLQNDLLSLHAKAVSILLDVEASKGDFLV